jgi:hypothetical protein
MLSYDDIVEMLERAWHAAGLHEHTLTESVQPDTHTRSYRVELFPEHEDPLTEENIPPWVEVEFSWTAAQQLRSEGRTIEPDALEIVWNYMVFVRSTMRTASDIELVRAFQQAVSVALQRFYPNGDERLDSVGVEVRRTYQGDGDRTRLAYVQLVSSNVTDLSEYWHDFDPTMLGRTIRMEVQLASAVIQALHDTFSSGIRGINGGYRTVDTA